MAKPAQNYNTIGKQWTPKSPPTLVNGNFYRANNPSTGTGSGAVILLFGAFNAQGVSVDPVGVGPQIQGAIVGGTAIVQCEEVQECILAPNVSALQGEIAYINLTNASIGTVAPQQITDTFATGLTRIGTFSYDATSASTAGICSIVFDGLNARNVVAD